LGQVDTFSCVFCSSRLSKFASPALADLAASGDDDVGAEVIKAVVGRPMTFPILENRLAPKPVHEVTDGKVDVDLPMWPRKLANPTTESALVVPGQ